MRNDDTSYDRYRRAEEELNQELEDRRRAADDTAQWERIRQEMREQGSLDEFESNLRNARRVVIRCARRHGKSLRDARLYADDVIARVQKDLIDRSRSAAKMIYLAPTACPGQSPEVSDPLAYTSTLGRCRCLASLGT